MSEVIKIGADHVRHYALMATVYEPLTSEQERSIKEIETLVESLSEGKKVLADRAEIIEARALAIEGFSTGKRGGNALHELCAMIDRWLSEAPL